MKKKLNKYPKLKIILPFGPISYDICTLEEAKNRFDYGSGTMIVVEGELVHSYEELVRIAIQDKFKNKELLEVELVPIIGGG